MTHALHKNMIDAHADLVIYRVYPLNRFINLLRTKTDTLVHPSLWDDPFENFFLDSRARTEGGEHVSLENLAEDWYGQCWTTTSDTDAMWRIYSPNKDGIKARTTVGKLFSNLNQFESAYPRLQFFIGKVGYRTKDQISELMKGVTFEGAAIEGTNDIFARWLCIKREAFEHEAEVRPLFNDLGVKKGRDKLVEYPLDANLVFEELVLDPRLSLEQEAVFRKQLTDNGCAINIQKSDLYELPDFEIVI